MGAFLFLAVLAQLTTLQQQTPAVPPEGPPAPSALVQAAEAAKAQQATRERIAALSREADALARESATLLDQLRQLDVERALQRAREAEARQDLTAIEADLAALTARQSQLQATLDTERPAVAARLRRLQRLGRVGYARIAWNAAGARQVSRAARLISYLSHDDGRRLSAYARTASDLADTQARLAVRQAEASRLREAAAERRAAADATYVRKRALLTSLQEEAGQRERWLAELVAARARLDESMGARPTLPAPTQVLRVPFTSRRRQLPWPVDGSIASRFGRQRDSRFGTSTLNNGVTIAAGSGTPVRAIHPGTVAFAGPFRGFGQLVVVDHGQKAFSLYGHLETVRVQRSATVEAGAVVGEVGETPEGGAGLYFEVRVDGRPVNPLQWLKRAQ